MKNSVIHYFTVFKKATLLFAITNFSLVYSNNTIQSHQRVTNTHNIRGRNDPKNRQLEWMVAGKTYHTVWDDNWYTWYDQDEIPNNVNTGGDNKDYLRDTDICPGTNEKYTRENCPVAPDCSKVNQKWGEGKLCINRVPLPFDTTRFYVAAMKCIPKWENCDKCVCGLIDYSTGLCKYHRGHNPDDDRQQVECSALERIGYKVVERGNQIIEFRPYEPLVTKSPTVSNSPSMIPSKQPTKMASNTPSLSLTPSVPPSSFPSYEPTIDQSAKPSLTPSSSPSSEPTIDQSAKPSLVPSSSPSSNPTIDGSAKPSLVPSSSPSSNPTIDGSAKPSLVPSSSPSSKPTISGSAKPTSVPTSSPSSEPTVSPTSSFSSEPSVSPTISQSPSLSIEPTFNSKTVVFVQPVESNIAARSVVAGFVAFGTTGIVVFIAGFLYLRRQNRRTLADSLFTDNESVSVA